MQCHRREIFPRDAIEEKLIKLYGPSGAGFVNPGLVSSWTFKDLYKLVSDSEEDSPDPKLKTALDNADWIIFGITEWLPRRHYDLAINKFLTWDGRRRQARVVAISFGAPYYLEPTEIRKLDAYILAYSKVEPFVEAAIQALFRDIEFQGSLPVHFQGYTATKSAYEKAIDAANRAYDSDDYALAVQRYERAMELARDESQLARLNQGLFQAYIGLGRQLLLDESYESAIDKFEKAERIAAKEALKQLALEEKVAAKELHLEWLASQ